MTATETKTNYEAIAEFDLKQFIGEMPVDGRVEMFRDLGDHTQEHADDEWLKTNDTYPYTEAFMSDWMVSHYPSVIEGKFNLFENGAFINLASADVVFEMRDGSSKQVVTPDFWNEMPREYLLKMLMKGESIDPAQVKAHLLVG